MPALRRATERPAATPAKAVARETPALLATSLSSAMRTSVGGKSPLTGTIKESNAGGTLSMRLAQHGYRALIVEGDVHATA